MLSLELSLRSPISVSTQLITDIRSFNSFFFLLMTDDIEVWIYEKNSSGEIVWEEKTEFQPQDVHHQYAIAFRLPTYKSLEVRL